MKKELTYVLYARNTDTLSHIKQYEEQKQHLERHLYAEKKNTGTQPYYYTLTYQRKQNKKY